MARMSSKELVYEYLEELTKTFRFDNFERFTTLDICRNLNMSRSLVSLYLNELVKEGMIIKISSRPVYYLNRNVLEKNYKIDLAQNEYLSVKELSREIELSVPEEKDFDKAIGIEGSLNYCISQIKSALMYPDGLPILLKGETGSGKTYLMKRIQEYCLNNQILLDIQKSKRVKLNQEKEEQQCRKISELLQELDGGILYLENIPEYSEKAQGILADYLAGNIQRKSNVRLVMSANDKTFSMIPKKILVRVPIICEVPSWIKRNEDERKQFVAMFLREEQEKIGKTLYISERLMYRLANYQYENNIAELKQVVTSVCANAYANSFEKDRIELFLYHLPAKMQGIVEEGEKDSTLIRLDVVQRDLSADRILEMWEMLSENYQDSLRSGGYKIFFETGKKTLKYYYDILIFKESFSDERLRPLEKVVAEMIARLHSMYNVNFPMNCAYVISRMMIAQQNHNSRLQVWEREHEEEIQKMQKLMDENMPEVGYLTDILDKQIQVNTNMKLTNMNKVFIMMNIHLYNNKLQWVDTTGVILCHGYTTASSIADTVNTILQVQLFEAIDMPLNCSVQDVIQKLSLFVEENQYYKNIVLMVDTGSLESLGEIVKGNMNLGIINNVSTILALSIGEKILAGEKMQDMLEKACIDNQCRYNIFNHTKKEKAIVFVSDSGKAISEKIVRLFKDSLPRSIPLEMIAYDYQELYENGHEDIVFKKYDVRLLVKTLNLKIPEVKSVTLEEIIDFSSIHLVSEVLSAYLTPEEIDEFKQTLLKNFSLQSVLENLTILNAQKLLNYVSDATSNLQHMLKRRFLSKTIIGINMHTCILIERLVTKTPVNNYTDLDTFVEENKEFIDIVNTSFKELLNNYNVELPLSEVAYLYEYVKHDEGVDRDDNTF